MFVSAEAVSSAPATLAETVALAFSRSPELIQARLTFESAQLAEPLFLSDLDTLLETGYSLTDDRSPRAVPAFEGTQSRLEQFNVDLTQKTLLGTEATVSWNNQRLENDATFRVLDPSVQSVLSFGIKQNLMRYLWGRPDVARRSRYRAEARAALENYRDQSSHLAARVAGLLLELGYATERVRIAGDGVVTAQRLVQSTREKKRFGMVEESETLQAEASLEAEETELLLAKSALNRARYALGEHVGIDVSIALSTPSFVFPAFSSPVPSSTDAAFAQAEKSRGDLQALDARMKSAEWAARSEILETLPELSLNASYGAAGLDRNYSGAWHDLDGFDHPIKTIGVNLVTPLAYRKERLLRKSKKLELEIARQAFSRARNQMEREVKDAWENLSLNKDRLRARARLVRLHQQKYRAERENFNRGRSSTDLLIRFQQEIHQAELAYARARVDELLAEIEMARATGVLLAQLNLERSLD